MSTKRANTKTLGHELDKRTKIENSRVRGFVKTLGGMVSEAHQRTDALYNSRK